MHASIYIYTFSEHKTTHSTLFFPTLVKYAPYTLREQKLLSNEIIVAHGF